MVLLRGESRRAVDYGLLARNPVEIVRMPAERRGKKRNKPFLNPAQFHQLLELIAEPYATMVYVAIYTGLRVSEVAGLRWEDIHEESITIDERFCRGDWGAPKSDASNATIAVNRSVIERIHRLRGLTVEVCGGGPKAKAVRKYRVVKKDGPTDLVFQSVKKGQPMRDNVAAIRAPTLPGGMMVLMHAPEPEQITFDAFAERVGKGKTQIEERIHDPLVHIDNDLAMVWARFESRVDGKVDHCGTDSFNLVRTRGKWMIAS